MKIPILAYHKIDNEFEWGINTVSPRLFEKQIRFLKEHGYSTIHLIDAMTNNFQCRKPVIITFDDAYKSVYEYAYPILSKFGYTATIFVVADYIGKRNLWDINLGGKTCMHLNLDELQQLVRTGWEVGSHTFSHCDLMGCMDHELYEELYKSKNNLEQIICHDVHFVSYPFNRVNTRVIRKTIAAGYKGGCCLASKMNIDPKYANYNIPRMGIYSMDLLFWFKLKLNSQKIATIDRYRQKTICFCANGSVYYNKLKKRKKLLQFKDRIRII